MSLGSWRWFRAILVSFTICRLASPKDIHVFNVWAACAYSEFFPSVCIFLHGLTSFQYARNVTRAFLVAFLLFSESLPSIKFCISSYDTLEKSFLLTSLDSSINHRWLKLKTGSVLKSALVNQADVSTC